VTLALLCSGQGHQGPETFALTAEAAGLFAHAAALLDGRDPRELVRRAPAAELRRNRTAQLLCTLQALAAHASLAGAWPRRLVVAGYSVGELAAWSVAGLLAPATALDLVARRAEAMDAATVAGDGLVFVRGLGRGEVEALCRRHDAAIAIVEPGGAWVLGGSGPALERIESDARSAGAHAVRIGGDVASHTPRLAAASTAFRRALAAAAVADEPAPGVRLLRGVDGATVVDVERGLDQLAAQVSHTVEWAACLDACVEAGAIAFLELGPGRALAGMAANAHGLPARSLDDFKTLDGVRAWLDRVGAG